MFSLRRAVYFLVIFLISQPLLAQSSSSNSNYTIYALIAVGLFVIVGAILTLSDNLIQIEAKDQGVDLEEKETSISSVLGGILGKSNPAFTSGAPVHRFKKGFDIDITGAAQKVVDSSILVNRYAVRPTNFRGIAPIPRLEVAVGDEVKAGDILFADKKNPTIKFVAPVSGEVVEIRRGEKRSISDVIILADKEIKYKVFDVPNLDGPRAELIDFLAVSGGLALINQRPYDELPSITLVPENIFISTFDTAPLAADQGLLLDGKEKAFANGIKVLRKLTTGKVHLGLDARGVAPRNIFKNAEGAQKHWFAGPHPAGNVGVQMHHTAPISRTGKVWTLRPQDVATIGELFLTGRYDVSRVVAVTGKVESPRYIKTYLGANIGEILKDSFTEDNVRIIAGDVLTGKKTNVEGFLNAQDEQLTVVTEGNKFEMFGWLLPLKPRPSISGTIPSFGDLKFDVNTNTHGEKRAFVVTGQYESMLPMDVLPQHLFKAIMAGDFERMEGLGINELSEEDVALCEFACTSKQPLQAILRDGLDMMAEQG